jgi:hypothetical protein
MSNMYCVFCGSDIPEQGLFCWKCGKKRLPQSDPSNGQESGISADSASHLDVSETIADSDATNARIEESADLTDQRFRNTSAPIQIEESGKAEVDRTLQSEPWKRIPELQSTTPSILEESPSEIDQVKNTSTPLLKRPWLWILGWYVGLLAYIVWSDWSRYSEQTTAYVILDSIGKMTNVLNLFLSICAVGIIFERSKANRDGSKSRIRRILGHPATLTLGTVAAIPLLASVIVISTYFLARHNADNTTAASPARAAGQTVNPSALDNYAIMSKQTDPPGSISDGISPDTKKRMRENFALALSGGMQKQSNPIQVEVAGTDHDVLIFRFAGMNDDMYDEITANSDSNFWNGLRLMDFKVLSLSGDNYRRAITRQEIVAHSANYEEYKRDFSKQLQGLQAGAKGEIDKE